MKWFKAHGLSLALLLVSLSLLSVFSYDYIHPLQPTDYLFLVIYLITIVFIDSFPLKINGTTISFSMVVTLAVLLRYGILVEVWLVLISNLVTYLMNDRRPITRIPVNLTMFTWVFAGGAYIYLLAGGDLGPNISINKNIIPIMLYVLSSFVINHLIISYIIYKREGVNILTSWGEMQWDIYSNLLAAPLGILLYTVHGVMGLSGMILVTIPTLAITYIFKMYNELQQSHAQLKALSDLSSQFTSELDLDKTVNSVMQAIEEIVDHDYCYIFETDDRSMFIKPLAAKAKSGEVIDRWDEYFIPIGNGVSGRVALVGEPLLIHERSDLICLESEPVVMRELKSIVSIPLRDKDRLVGVITLGNEDSFVFSARDVTLLQILASQATVAIQNARRYQSTERRSQIDELTGLFNYRTFDAMLQQTIQHSNHDSWSVSLIVMDIDHFKAVNDQHGHIAGNEILVQLADIIRQNVRREDIVARYGGEEFTVILPNATEKEAVEIAERIRKVIEETSLVIKHDMHHSEEHSIHVTMSIGIASYPEQADSATSLLRHADRAMYIGSKRGGRNKVSLYRTLIS